MKKIIYGMKLEKKPSQSIFHFKYLTQKHDNVKTRYKNITNNDTTKTI